jgi:hypothetical protein
MEKRGIADKGAPAAIIYNPGRADNPGARQSKVANAERCAVNAE